MKSYRLSSASSGVFHRRGFSLIEVIMATAILLGSVVVLSRLAGMGRSHAQNTEQMAQAQRVCENTLNELLIGIRPLVPAESAPLMPLEQTDRDVMLAEEEISEDLLRPGQVQNRLVGAGNLPVWRHSIRLVPQTEMPGLSSLTVEVVSTRRLGRERTRASLTRWIRQSPEHDPFGEFSSEGDQPFGGIAQ